MNPVATPPKLPVPFEDSASASTGYKQTDIAIIPADWDLRTLGAIGQCFIGLTYKPSDVKPAGHLVLRSSNVGDGVLEFDDNVFVDVEVPEKLIVREGDLLICVRNGSRRLIGKCALIDMKADGMTFGAFMALYRSSSNPFVFYCFQSNLVKRQIQEHLGATINQITNKSLNSFRIPFPSSEEQLRITAALVDIDKLIRTLERMVLKKRAIRQAAARQLIEGRTRLPSFSEEWTPTTAGQIGRFRGGSGFPLVHQGASEGDYPLFKVSDMNNRSNGTWMTHANNWVSEEVRKTLGAIVFPSNSIVFAKVGAAVFLERKRLLAYPSCLDNNMAALVLDHNRTDHRFVLAWLMSKTLGDLVAATAMPSINGKQLASLPIALPPLREQRAIATVLWDMDSDVRAVEERLAKVRAVKEGVMQALLTGRVRLIGQEVRL